MIELVNSIQQTLLFFEFVVSPLCNESFHVFRRYVFTFSTEHGSHSPTWLPDDSYMARTHASLTKTSMKLLIRIHNLQSRVVLQLEHIWADGWLDWHLYRVHGMQIMKHIYDAWDSSFCRSQEKDPTLHEPAIMHHSRAAAVGVDWGMSARWNEADFSHMRAERPITCWFWWLSWRLWRKAKAARVALHFTRSLSNSVLSSARN